MRLDAGVDDERAGTAPVLLLGEFAIAADVGCRVAAGESDPEEVVQSAGGEFAVIDEDDEGKSVKS